MAKYIAFLRGINSGKNPSIKMEVLKKAFEDVGFNNVKTVIASGNVIFESEPESKKELTKKIESKLPSRLGFNSSVILWSIADLEALVALQPFEERHLNGSNRPFVTFIKYPKPLSKISWSFPYKMPEKGYTILGIFNGAVCSVIELSDSKTPDLMKVLEVEFGKDVTTRSWKTVERIVKASL